VHAVWFAWAGQPSFIEPPALAVMSTTFFVVAAWMAYVPPAAVRVR
jgi:hypothetical protein